MDENNAVVSTQELDYGKLFRPSVVGGFNKQDVLNYIDRMAKKRKKDEERYAEHIHTLEAERDKLTAELQSIREASENNEKECSDAKAEASALKEKLKLSEEFLEAVKDELDLVQSKLDEAELKYKELDTKYAESCVELEQLKKECKEAAEAAAVIPQQIIKEEESVSASSIEQRCSELEEKLRRYELERMKINEVEEAAYKNARKIEAEAVDYQNKLKIEMNENISRMNATLNAMTERIDNAMRCVNIELNDFNSRYSAIRQNVTTLQGMLQSLK